MYCRTKEIRRKAALTKSLPQILDVFIIAQHDKLSTDPSAIYYLLSGKR